LSVGVTESERTVPGFRILRGGEEEFGDLKKENEETKHPEKCLFFFKGGGDVMKNFTERTKTHVRGDGEKHLGVPEKMAGFLKEPTDG